jgi:hypothetical protein
MSENGKFLTKSLVRSVGYIIIITYIHPADKKAAARNDKHFIWIAIPNYLRENLRVIVD